MLKEKIALRIKVISRLDISEERVPQDGRLKLVLSKTKAIDFRVSTLPTLFGEKIDMRILDSSGLKLGIEALGYEPDQKEALLSAIGRPYGLILVTGPTGSGKTVSLYTGVGILNTADRNISTVEDPVEINLPGVNQVQVDERTGMSFAKALKAFLRQDPDVILVGEIRDFETGSMLTKEAAAVSSERYAPNEFKLTLHGETFHIKLTGSVHHGETQRPFYVAVDGISVEVVVETLNEIEVSSGTSIGKKETAAAAAGSERPRPSHQGCSCNRHARHHCRRQGQSGRQGQGRRWRAGHQAMKMENEIQAPISGIVISVHVKNGDSVAPDETLIEIQ